MSTSQTLALIGFPPNEMSAFKALFRLAARSGTSYVMVEQAHEAQIMLANADDADAVRSLHSSQPRARVLLIGPSDHGTGWLVQRRPIQLLTVLDAVRALGAPPPPAPSASPAPAAGFAPTMPFEPSTQPAATGPLWDEPSSVPPAFAATEPFAPLEMPRAAAVPDSGGFPLTQPYVSGFPATEPFGTGADLQALREVFAKSMPAPVDAIDPASIALWREARRVNAAEAPATAAPVAVSPRVPMPPVPRFVSSDAPALPRSAELRPQAPDQLAPAAASASADVLVVDAGDMSRRTLELYLQEHGFRPNLVRSGVEARDQLATHSYRLVFVNEPVAGGSVFRVCRAVRRQANADGSRPTVVLVLSSRRGWWDRWRARLAGCDVCLVRPFNQDVLGRVLTRFAVAANSA